MQSSNRHCAVIAFSATAWPRLLDATLLHRLRKPSWWNFNLFVYLPTATSNQTTVASVPVPLPLEKFEDSGKNNQPHPLSKLFAVAGENKLLLATDFTTDSSTAGVSMLLPMQYAMPIHWHTVSVSIGVNTQSDLLGHTWLCHYNLHPDLQAASWAVASLRYLHVNEVGGEMYATVAARHIVRLVLIAARYMSKWSAMNIVWVG